MIGNDNPSKISQNPWYVAANYSLLAITTSAAVLAVQNPLKSMMVNQLNHGSVFGPSINAGRLSMIKSFYTGLRAQVAGASARSAYVSSSKKSVSQESAGEMVVEEGAEPLEFKPKRTAWSNVGQVMALSLGEVIITQVSESLSQLQKAGVVTDGFKWQTPHNITKLFTNGFAARLGSGFVNFSALCIIESEVARALPIENKPLKHAVAGSMSGMLAAVFSYPFSYYKDYALTRTVIVEGRLKNFSVLEAKAQLQDKIASCGMRLVTQQALETMKVQLPLRMANTAATFAVVSMVDAALGKDPIQTLTHQWHDVKTNLRRVGFFGASSSPKQDDSPASEIEPPDFF